MTTEPDLAVTRTWMCSPARDTDTAMRPGLDGHRLVHQSQGIVARPQGGEGIGADLVAGRTRTSMADQPTVRRAARDEGLVRPSAADRQHAALDTRDTPAGQILAMAAMCVSRSEGCPLPRRIKSRQWSIPVGGGPDSSYGAQVLPRRKSAVAVAGPSDWIGNP